jgi:hypothetical protein
MGARFARLPGFQHGGKRNLPHFYGRHRPLLTSRHARWLATHTPPRRYHLWRVPPPLETGLVPVVTISGYSGHSSLLPS